MAKTRITLEAIYRAVESHPGILPKTLGRVIGYPYPTNIYPRLPLLEEAGYLLSEDDQGRLYPYRIVGRAAGQETSI